jgi:hypothetical protein
MIRGAWSKVAVLSTVLLVSLPRAAAQLPAAYTFTIYDVPGANATELTGINDRGEITGVYRTADGVGHGFLLSADRSTTTPAGFAGRQERSAGNQLAWPGGVRLGDQQPSDGTSAPINLKGLRSYGINNAGPVLLVANSQSPPFTATVFLNDPDGSPTGRHLDLPYNVLPPRPPTSITVAVHFLRRFSGHLCQSAVFRETLPGAPSGRSPS